MEGRMFRGFFIAMEGRMITGFLAMEGRIITGFN
jgi:hypothetical protein